MRFYLILILSATFFELFAQNTTNPVEETPAIKAAKTITADFPSTRPFTIEYQQTLGRDYTSQLGGEDFEEGRVDGQRRINVGINLPIYYRPELIVSTSLNYTFDELSFDRLERVQIIEGKSVNKTNGFHAYSGALNLTHISELFGKQAIFIGGLVVDGGGNGIERVKGRAGATLSLKKTERTSLSVGILAIVDPTSQLPFVPIVRYKHEFKDSPWMLDLVLPSQLLLRRNIGTRSRLSVGTTFGGSGYYVNIERPNFAQDYEYSQLELNAGLIYEYKLTNALILSARGGVTSFLSNRLTEKGEPNRDFVYNNKQGATGYFSIGISYNPFTK